jgi:Anti-anti-sigma regulatory factor (antagonist of anti-sigma factor)
MAELKITSQTLTASTAVCKLEGDLDGGNFDLLEDEFNKLLESGVLGVVMDLSALESFASSGLGAIVNMAIVLRARGGKLIAASLRPGVLGTIEMLGVQEALSVADSLDAARKAIASVK